MQLSSWQRRSFSPCKSREGCSTRASLGSTEHRTSALSAWKGPGEIRTDAGTQTRTQTSPELRPYPRVFAYVPARRIALRHKGTRSVGEQWRTRLRQLGVKWHVM